MGKEPMTKVDPHSRPVTSGDFAYAALTNAIVTGELEADSRIVQADWAEKLGVSVTPLREAIRRLQADGMVKQVPHKGATVVGLRRDEAEEIYSLREILEPKLVAPAIEAITPQIHEVALALCNDMSNTTDPTLFSELNTKFHSCLTDTVSGWTARLAYTLRMAAAPYVNLTLRQFPEQMQSSNQEHFELLEAYDSRDVEKAKTVAVRHLRSSLSLLRKCL